MSHANPCLRSDLDFIPVTHEGKQLFLIRDPLGLVVEGRAVPGELGPVLALLDGSRSRADLVEEMTRRGGGVLVSGDDLDRLLAELDHGHLLDSERYRAARQAIVDEFTSTPVREAVMAGRSYPDGADELTGWLDTVMAQAPEHAEQAVGAPLALVAPHIDPAVGARVYASTYQALSGAAPERVLVLGIGHAMYGDLFSVTDKTFRTPLGDVPSLADEAAALRGLGCPCLAPDDFDHRAEHSIEFQALFLRHILGRDAFAMLPILCGSLAALPEYTRQAYQDEAGPVLEYLRGLAAAPDALVVAGVDFSHIGPKFGHQSHARALEPEATAHDRALLERLVQADADGFWKESARVQDRYNVCGFAAMACLLEILPDAAGTVLDYHMGHEEPTSSAVSFAAVAFHNT
jgi:hypothetical protein